MNELNKGLKDEQKLSEKGWERKNHGEMDEGSQENRLEKRVWLLGEEWKMEKRGK